MPPGMQHLLTPASSTDITAGKSVGANARKFSEMSHDYTLDKMLGSSMRAICVDLKVPRLGPSVTVRWMRTGDS